jgi:hypothetical protein
VLIQAGARLSGLDGAFAALSFKAAVQNGDKIAVSIWSKVGLKVENS